jgi:hypothetical protein
VNENNRDINKAKWIDSSIVILFFAGILLFLFFSGTLNSGYHFIDDHEMLKIHADLEKTSFVGTSIQWIKNDFSIRFRPMYFLHRVSEIKIFGDDSLSLSFYTGILAALTFSFFYFGAKKLKYSVLESLLLVLLAFIGPQMVIWWQLGPNETIGMFFLALSFFYMAKCTENNKYLLNNILFSISLVFASLSKENFTILIPVFVFYKIWIEKERFKMSVMEIIRKNYLYFILLIVMAIEIWIIVFMVGTNKIGYAGSTSGTGELFHRVRDMLIGESMLSGWLKLTALLSFIYFSHLIILKLKEKINIKHLILKLLPPLFFSFLIVLPNIIFYAKSGMMERYLLPITFGFAFFAINVIRNTNINIIRKATILICIAFLFTQFNTSIRNASAFANDGLQTGQLLSAVINNTNSNQNILLVADPVDRFEVSDSLKIYLSSKGINNIYAYPVSREYHSDFEYDLERKWKGWFENKTLKDISGNPDIIIFIDKIQLEQFFNQSNISQSEYHNILDNNTPHAVYIKNNSS